LTRITSVKFAHKSVSSGKRWFCRRAWKGGADVIEQPYPYQRRELAEPDWRRFPGWAAVTAAEWESAQWQRAHCV
jgi:lysine 2,3-aminomutase